MHQYGVNIREPIQNCVNRVNHCESPNDSVSSYSNNDYNNRDAECLNLTEVRNIAPLGARDNF